MERLSWQEARLIDALRRVPRVSPARAAPPRRAASKRKPKSPDAAQKWAEALERGLPPPVRPRQAALDSSDELFSSGSAGSASPLRPQASSSSAPARACLQDQQTAEEEAGVERPRKRLRLLSAEEVRQRDAQRTSSSTAPVGRVSPPRWRVVEPGETLTITPVPQPAAPYVQTWTRPMDDGRTLRVVNRVPRPPRLLTSEPRRQAP